jgi:hypothetical protein
MKAGFDPLGLWISEMGSFLSSFAYGPRSDTLVGGLRLLSA